MRIRNIALILLAIILAGPLALSRAGQQGDPYAWDFGSANEGQLLVHTFTLESPQKPLHINDLQASCSCTVFEVSGRDIPAGGSAEIKVTVDTSGRAGKMTQYVYVQTDDLSQPVIKLTVQADIVRK